LKNRHTGTVARDVSYVVTARNPTARKLNASSRIPLTEAPPPARVRTVAYAASRPPPNIFSTEIARAAPTGPSKSRQTIPQTRRTTLV
jgi:hypothetical protein